MISALCWIPRCAATGVSFAAEPQMGEEPDKPASLDNNSSNCDCNDKDNTNNDDENGMDIVADDGDQDEGAVKQASKDVTNALSSLTGYLLDCATAGLQELNMESYDKEECGVNIFCAGGSGELYYTKNDMDPNFKKKSDGEDDDEEAEEIEDMTVRPTDMLIVSAYNKEDRYNYLKIAIAEELKDGCLNIYSCLEIPLRSPTLSLAWTDCGLKDGQKGNFMAIGTMNPEIEIWDLNTMLRYKKGSHTDSVLHVAWNMEYKNILASASADKTVKIWDANAGECVSTLAHHDSMVQAVAWCQRSPEIILSGSFDKTVALKDVKNCALDCIKWSVETVVETVAWDPHNEHVFVASLENGMVQAFDTRRASSSQHSSLAMFTLHAHEKAVSSVSFCSVVPNLLATASNDKMVKLWDISNNQPLCIASLDRKVGPVFSASFSNDRPFLLAVGGREGDVSTTAHPNFRALLVTV